MNIENHTSEVGYILLTPIMNESKYLHQLKETVLSQNVMPKLWIIIDGNSSDNSFELLHDLFQNCDWVYIIKQNVFFDKGYSHKNFAQAVNEAFEFSKQICREKNIAFKYVGKIDGTVELKNNYFECLINEMEEDPKLAIICGLEKFFINGLIKRSGEIIPDLPLSGYNDNRLYCLEFLEEVRGYPLNFSPDAILLLKAIHSNWKVKVIDKTYYYERRLTGSKIGIWRGYSLRGKAMYGLGYHPFLVMMTAIYNTLRISPHYTGFAVLYGYLIAYIRRDEKINDEEIRRYFSKERLDEVNQLLFHYIKKLFSFQR